MATDNGIGSDVQRREDRQVLLGESKGTDDIDVPGALHIQFIRSEKAHARFDIDAETAREMNNVVKVFTPEDIEQCETSTPLPFRLFAAPMPDLDYPDEALWQRCFASTKAHYHGEILGIVVAETQRVARDALEMIDITYDDLEPALTTTEALADDTPAVHDDVPDNVVFSGGQGDEEAVAERFEQAAYTAELKKDPQRLSPSPLEPRSAIAAYDSASGHLDFTATTQIPHAYRRLMAQMLTYPEHHIDVTVPDMGGGFGARQHPYPADVLVGWCAIELEDTVRWRATRTENQLVENDGRGYEGTWEIAMADDGDLLGVRADIQYDLGAWVAWGAASLAEAGNLLMTGLYDIPTAYSRVTGVVTNTARVDAYRGVSSVPMILMLERLVSKVAKQADMDPAMVRKQNFVEPDQFPYRTPGGALYDSGDYERNFDLGLETVEYQAVREKQERLREEGRYIGIGFACATEVAGLGPASHIDAPSWGYGSVQVHPTGDVTVYSGGSDHGQGHETSLAQVAADELGVPFDDVRVVENSTKEVAEGVGTFASRSAALGGGAVAKSCRKIISKGMEVAADELNVPVEAVMYDNGMFIAGDNDTQSFSFSDMASKVHLGQDIPDDVEPGLEAQTYYDPDNCTWPFGTHIVVIEIDPETGEFDFLDYVATEDCGVQINPTIVEGQLVGAIAQGIGQALYEDVEYGDDGTLLSNSFRTERVGSRGGYTLPKAEHMPEITIRSTETPSPHTPHGAKGMGEMGSIAAPGAILNAIEDAIEPFDPEPMTPPISSEKVWQAINGGGE
jgi:Aerobic-type carbon monoxide dehydrogenase, large subunit CoxL/CutL homologs